MTEEELQTGQRVAPRMELSLPGKLLALQGDQRCIITNLSRTGSLIGISTPLNVGQEAYLQCGPIDHFVSVVRKGRGQNALTFDSPFSDAFVFKVRQFQRLLAERDERELMETARRWSQGADGTGN